VALKDADMRTPGGVSILPLGTRRFRPLERPGAGLTAGVGCQEMVVGGISPAPAEAGVGEVAGRSGVHGLTPRAAPGGGGGVCCCRRCISRGGRGAHPLADAGEVEYGEAAGAGPDGRRAPHHVVAYHALHRAAGELVLDLLHQLRHRPIASSRRRRRRGGGSGSALTGRSSWRGSRPLRRRTAATVSRVVVLLLRRGRGRAATVVVVPVVVAVIGAARAAVGRPGLRGRGSREGQDRAGGGVGARGRAGGRGGAGGAGAGAGAPLGAGGGGHGSTPAAAIGGGLHTAAGREG